MIPRPIQGEQKEYFFNYINQVPDGDVLELIKNNDDTVDFLEGISEDHWTYRYEPGKWSVKEVLNHIIDTERVMAYRALRIGRNDITALPGFDQDLFVKNWKENLVQFNDLITDYKNVRAATVSLFQSLDEQAVLIEGSAGGNMLTPARLIYIIAGHEIHHLKVIKDRYMNSE